jgi:hypothetical protein
MMKYNSRFSLNFCNWEGILVSKKGAVFYN